MAATKKAKRRTSRTAAKRPRRSAKHVVVNSERCVFDQNLAAEAVALIPSLTTDEKEAAVEFLRHHAEAIAAIKDPTYAEIKRLLKAIHRDAASLQKGLNALASSFNDIGDEGLEDLYTLWEKRNLVDEVLWHSDWTTSTWLEDAIKGGHGGIESRLTGSRKFRLVHGAAILWYSCTGSISGTDDDAIANFICLAYEAATGVEDAKGLRDNIRDARKSIEYKDPNHPDWIVYAEYCKEDDRISKIFNRPNML